MALILKNLNTVQSEDTVGAFGHWFTELMLEFWFRAGETTQQIKVLATKDLPELIPGAQTVEREHSLWQDHVCLLLPINKMKR